MGFGGEREARERRERERERERRTLRTNSGVRRGWVIDRGALPRGLPLPARFHTYLTHSVFAVVLQK